MKYKQLLFLFAFVIKFGMLTAQTRTTINIDAANPAGDIQSTMWGVFFEDINMGADGGLYAELVKNRSFEFYKPMMGWTVTQPRFREGSLTVLNRQEKNVSNPRFLRVTADKDTKGSFGIINEGFRGMGVKKGLRYDFSMMYRTASDDLRLHVALIDSTGNELGGVVITPAKSSKDWERQTASFVSSATLMKAKLVIWFEGSGTIDLDMVSLFPEDTWKKRPGGMRADMVQLLADMKPGFIRFPGGCIVEGFDLSQRYQWKKTIGPLEERQLLINRWNFEFAHRPTPDYFQTFGLGFFEYFQLAEDIGAEPLPILNCGMACQFNTGEIVPLDQLDPYVQDALDLIEFANGDATTIWGKRRAEAGHPAPFNMKMIGVGNENWGPQYIERLKIFTEAIQKKYPSIKIVSSAGTDPDGERFDLLNTALRKMKADIIDEHYYRRPEWFLANASRYDHYDRTGPKIFAGEYAAQSDKTVSVDNRNNWTTAIAEAAFMTGLERNADIVAMASYAPLFAHADGWQWTPDLIWVNNLTAVGTVNYQVQKMFSVNRGTQVVKATAENAVLSGQNGLYVSASIDRQAGELIVKVVNSSTEARPLDIAVDGVKRTGTEASFSLLHATTNDAMNTLDQPGNILPVTTRIPVKKKRIDLTVEASSFAVIRVPIQ